MPLSLGSLQLETPLTEQPHLKVQVEAVLELSIISHDRHQQSGIENSLKGRLSVSTANIYKN